MLIDTNILVYSVVEEASDFSRARSRLRELEESGEPLYICPQIVKKFLAVLTRGKAFAVPVAPPRASEIALELLARYELCDETAATAAPLAKLISQQPSIGDRVYDANLVAVALENSIPAILTANVKDFRPFAGLVKIESL